MLAVSANGAIVLEDFYPATKVQRTGKGEAKKGGVRRQLTRKKAVELIRVSTDLTLKLVPPPYSCRSLCLPRAFYSEVARLWILLACNKL